MAETIDHLTLSNFTNAGVIKKAHIVGQIGGWFVSVKCGGIERALTTQRSQKTRLFRKLETLVSYLKTLGITEFYVDSKNHQPIINEAQKRPDRAIALKRAHEAATYDAWFREEVKNALIEADAPNASWVSNEEVKAIFADKRSALLNKITGEKA